MKRFIAKLLFVVIIATLPANAVRAQKQTTPETLIRNATVLTITRGTLQNTDVLLRNGKIAAVGKNLNASANAVIPGDDLATIIRRTLSGLLSYKSIAA